MNCTPKNVRQIGDVDYAHKIYVEDYVITFARSIGNIIDSDNWSCNAAVLLGKKNMAHTEVETYVSGAVIIEDFKLTGETAFSNEMWSGIYDKIKEYYDDEEIVGWMYVGNGPQIQLDTRLINIHASNFGGRNMIFMVYDCDEKEESFYDYIDNSFVSRKGFYIYYQKNDTMHNYMIYYNGGEAESCEREERVVKDIRTILGKRAERQNTKKLVHSAYAAGMLVAAVALLIGTTVIYKYNGSVEKGRNIDTAQSEVQSAVPQVPVAAMDQQLIVSDKPQPVVSADPQIAAASIQPGNTAVSAEPQQVEATAKPQPVEVTKAPQEVKAVSSNNNKPNSFYIVKDGDSLSDIAENIYNSVNYMKKIMELNKISDADKIYEGQKLWLPEQ